MQHSPSHPLGINQNSPLNRLIPCTTKQKKQQLNNKQANYHKALTAGGQMMDH
jgi:hypothetical protein